MSLLCVFYNFNKRYNSTKTVDNSSITVSGNITLKMPTSLHNPTIVFACGTNDMPTAMTSNYCVFNNTSYWIRDSRILSNTHIEFDCEVDVLATYKNQILLTNAYMIYSSLGSSYLVDNRLPPKTNETISKHTATFMSQYSPTIGTYIVGITGEASTAFYVIPPSYINKLSVDFDNFSQAFNNGITELYEDMPEYSGTVAELEVSILSAYVKYVSSSIVDGFKQLVGSGSLNENIRSAIWLPFNISGDALVSPLKVGMYSLDFGAYMIQKPIITNTVSIAIPWQVSDFRRKPPYTYVYLYVPFIGMINISSDQLSSESNILINISLNKTSGDLMVRVATASDETIGVYASSTACSYPIGSSNINIGQALMNVASASITTGLAGNIGLAASAGALFAGFQPYNTTAGGSGGSAMAGSPNTITIYTVLHNSSQSPSTFQAEYNLPTYGLYKIGDCTGFIQTSGASVSINATAEEIQQVNSLLDGGVYIE